LSTVRTRRLEAEHDKGRLGDGRLSDGPFDQMTVPVSPLPFDSMCQDQSTFPHAPMVSGAPLKETGALPVEYTTLAVHVAPGEVKA
jgi:hypothetical protein